MKIRIHRHTHHYGILVLFLFSGMMAFLLAKGNNQLQFSLGVLLAFGYAAWGMFHHLYNGDFNRKIMVEYTVVAAVVISILWALLLPNFL